MNISASLIQLAGHPKLLRQREWARSVGRMQAGFRVRTARSSAGGYVPGLLSVIVPAYNVEAYIGETLDSVIRQAHRLIEVIVVDDGSPDDSVAVARRYARKDRRIVIVRRPNGGLGAARNTGVSAARGEFLTFLDSDDTVLRNAYAPLVRTLQHTGSDFAVAPYRRQKGVVFPPAGPWIRQAHRDERLNCTLEEFPDILVNSMACSKVFRRTFWDRAELSFPVGVQYEDQALTAKAYARASRFDVTTEVGLNWRIRDDGTSITQQLASAKGIRDLTRATLETAEILGEYSTAEVRDRRIAQILSNDLSHFLPNLGNFDEDAWEAMRAALVAIPRLMSSPATWEQVPARSRVLYSLIQRGEREDAEQFLLDGGWATQDFETRLNDDHVLVRLPFWDAPGSDESAYRLAESETRLRTSTLRVDWKDASRLCIEGHAFVDNLNQAAHQRELSAALVSPTTGRRIPATVIPMDVEPEDFPARLSPWCDPSAVGFRLEVDATELDLADDGYHVELSVTCGLLSRSAELDDGRDQSKNEGRFVGEHLIDLVRDHAGRLTIHPRRVAARLLSSSFDDNRTVALRLAGDRLAEVALVRDDDRFALFQYRTALKTDPVESGHSVARVRLPPLPRKHSREWRIMARRDDGPWEFVYGPDVPLGVDADARIPSTTIERRRSSLYRSTVSARDGLVEHVVPAGIVSLWRNATRAILTSLDIGEDQLRLTISHVGFDPATMEVQGRFRGETTVLDTRPVTDHLLEVIVNAPNGTGKFAFGAGRIRLFVSDGRVRQEPRLHPAVIPALPVTWRTSRARVRLTVRGSRTLLLEVRKPLRPDELGSFAQRKLRARSAELTVREPRSSIFFRCLYGEDATDTALAVHNEVRRRGLPVDLIWSVSGYDKFVPEGGRAVIEESREFHEAIATSSILVFNIHQPTWFSKRPGQTVVETLHGYPFKLAGRPWWERMDLSPIQIDSYDRRARDWDLLLSPAPYATPLLREGFLPPTGFQGEIFEAGYPRNDILLSAERDDVRARVRAELGLADDRIVILYAPTFRDYLSGNDTSAPMVGHVDFDRLSRRLGPRYVFLSRGHAFNARHEGGWNNDRVIDVTSHPDIAGLCLASDGAILDYSSLRFDYALTDNPMVFHVPDEEQYFRARPAFLPYETTSPGPKTRTNSELAAALQRLAANSLEYAGARQRFRRKFMPLEDGHAAERLVGRLFDDDSAA